MNLDEFAFFNQQLAAMLREGIPLEGALRQLSAGMKSKPLRAELQQLEADLSKGTPLKEALSRRALPPLYARMLEIGVRSNDLPGVLTLLADHYHRANLLWMRLKGLMVYPLLVVIVSLGLTLLVSMAFGRFFSNFYDNFMNVPNMLVRCVWMPPLLLSLIALVMIGAIFIPRWRSRLRWRLPAFHEASLAQTASMIALMLRNGTTLTEALALAESLESGTPAAKPLAQWRSMIESGQGKPEQWPSSKAFPSLFMWLVRKGGENVAAGFQKAADIYRGRASYRIELALYGALPISILLLGQMVFWQIAPLMQSMVWMMNMLGDMGGGSS